jgi:hypothetical protein
MRHVLAACAIAAGSFGMGEASAAAGLVASSRVTPGPAAGLRRAIAGAVDLAAVATATDQDLRTAPDTDEQPSRGGLGIAVTESTGVPWTTAPIVGILAPHACPARVWGTASSVTAKFRSAPCLPLDTGKPYPDIRRSVSPNPRSPRGPRSSQPPSLGPLEAAEPRQNPLFAGFARIHAASDMAGRAHRRSWRSTRHKGVSCRRRDPHTEVLRATPPRSPR